MNSAGNEVTCELLKQMFDDGQKVIVLDIRTYRERMRLNIGGVAVEASRLSMFAKTLNRNYAGYKIVIACNPHMARAKSAQKSLMKLGIKSYVLKGGIAKWTADYRNHKLPTK